MPLPLPTLWLLLTGCGADSDAEAVAAICASAPCSGPGAHVVLWRDDAGSLAVLEHRGSLTRCSHPPTSFRTPAGDEVLGQANRPVTGPEDAQRFVDERDAVLGGLKADPRHRACR